MLFEQFLFLLILSAPFCKAFQQQSLNGNWIVSGEGTKINFNATVPGGIFTDLMNHDVIDDIFFGFGDYNYRWVGEINWTYTTTFTVDEGLLTYENIFLVFEGLDTLATILVNGEQVGTTANMFVRYVFNVKNQLDVGSNIITVKFDAPVNIAAALAKVHDDLSKCPPIEFHGICHVNLIRKMQASFSSDCGPAFASVGIWKDVFLKALDAVEVESVIAIPKKKTDESAWTLVVNIFLSGGEVGMIVGSIKVILDVEESVLTSTIDITDAHEELQTMYTTTLDVSSDLINVWWPNGYGTQQMYSLIVIFSGDNGVSEKSVKVGFRTIELVQDELETGLTFYFKVNGQSIFAKGANEIPINILPEKGQDPKTIKFLLQSAKDVNMNMLRVWGGGVYESDYFYDLADEYGILIWQDLMFSCALYPSESAFLENVRAEIRHQVKRLANHPSLAIFSGNNENEIALAQNWFSLFDSDTYRQNYVNFYVDVIKKEVLEILPNIAFVTSSPSNGLKSTKNGHIAENPGDWENGDIHYYDYGVNDWDPNTFPIPRFVSEYGYQSLPSIESWYTATKTLDNLLPNSSFLESRQHHPGGNKNILNSISSQFELPDVFDKNYFKALIYFSQILQAQAIKTQTEHYRSFKGRLNAQGQGYTMGALYWQLNDVWVAPTWSGIEFTRRYKMLHYQAQDFFNNLIVTGLLYGDRLDIYAIFDGLQVPNMEVKLLLAIYRWDSLEPCITRTFSLALNTEKAVLVTSLDSPTALIATGCGGNYKVAKKTCFFYLRLVDMENTSVAPSNYIFPEKLKASFLVDANLQIESVTATDKAGLEYDIAISTDAVTLFVWLDAHAIMGRFSENGFLLVTSQKVVHFFAEEPTTVENLIKVLTVTHVRDAAYL